MMQQNNISTQFLITIAFSIILTVLSVIYLTKVVLFTAIFLFTTISFIIFLSLLFYEKTESLSWLINLKDFHIVDRKYINTIYRTILLISEKLTSSLVIYSLFIFFSYLLLIYPETSYTIYSDIWLISVCRLPALTIIRVVAGIFFISVFPGYIILHHLKNCFRSFLHVEKIAFLLIFSTIYFAFVGSTLLLYLQITSPVEFIKTYILSLYIFLFGILLFSKYTETKKLCVVSDWNTATPPPKYHLIFASIPVIAFVILSYLQVLFSHPMSGLLWSDPADYLTFAGRYIFWETHTWIYIGVPLFTFGASFLVGLPGQFTFVFLQYLQICLPLSVYIATYRVTKRHDVSIITIYLLLFFNGVTSLLLLTNYNYLELYLQGDFISSLWTFLFKRTGSPGMFTPHHLIASSFDISLSLLAFCYSFVYIFEDKKRSIHAIIATLFSGAAFFFHSLNALMLYFGVLFFMIVFTKGNQRRKSIKLFIFSSISLFISDFFTKFYSFSFFIPLEINRFLSLINTLKSVNDYYSILYSFAPLILLTMLVVFVITARGSLLKTIITNHFLIRIKEFFGKYYRGISIIIGILIPTVAIASYLFFFTLFPTHTYHWKTGQVVYPINFIIYKYYGILVGLAIIILPHLHQELNRFANRYITFLCLSMITVSGLSLIFPTILTPALVYYRYMGYLLFPISIYSSIFVVRLNKSLLKVLTIKRKKRRYGILISYMLFIYLLLSVPVISHIHSYEIWYIQGKKQLISSEYVDTANWINKNISNETNNPVFLVFSSSSERILYNLVLNIKIIPFGSDSYNDILTSKTHNEIHKKFIFFNISYVYLTESDMTRLEQTNKILYEYIISLRCIYSTAHISVFAVF